MSETPRPGSREVSEHAPGEALLDVMEPAGATPSGPITRVHSPLSWRAEVRRQWGRRRTTWAFGLLLALPLVLVGSFFFGERSSNSNRGGASSRIFDLAQDGAANFSLVLVFLASELLLVLLAALFCGDAVPSEASWASLRYLLVAPVQRARLLTSKLVVGVGSTLLATVLLPAWGLLVGGIFYGWDPLTNPLGENLTWGQFLPRLVLAMAYIFITLLPIAAIAFWLGTRSDAPLAAVGGAVLVSILLNILDQLDALDPYRNAFPGHYSRAWQDALAVTPDYSDMLHGALWSLVWAVAFTMLAYRRFRRSDILS
ncbi:ABC-2 type transport system permease protein [Humibacillus xanthopallidus]|uniref:ABC-2 type transport system permease protein n=1 Tax=Humibacillus xanthopallidus TaxID=412689 RepID=A0A543PPB2_9MICO|nr:ABC transporter permease [Humibacillus xanthopallidus]TQN45911.1 ABC-2 type transport system permease protein [Humibacillus xanthopallidus]